MLLSFHIILALLYTASDAVMAEQPAGDSDQVPSVEAEKVRGSHQWQIVAELADVHKTELDGISMCF